MLSRTILSVRPNGLFSNRNFSANPATLFKSLKTRIGRNEQVSIGELSNILHSCSKQHEYKYAVKGVKLMQKNGYDFNQEICSLLIKVCSSSGKSSLAAELLANEDFRVGTWLSQKSLTKLIDELILEENGVIISSSLVLSTWSKGLNIVTSDIVSKIEQAAVSRGKLEEETVQNLLKTSKGKF